MPDEPNPRLRSEPADPPTEVAPGHLPYAELDVTSNFSFLRGASHPDELVYQAAELGYAALAITDVNSLAGVARAYEKAKKVRGFRLIVGARLVFSDGSPDVLVWPSNRPAYARLSRLLTHGRRRADKGQCLLRFEDFLAESEGQFAAICPTDGAEDGDDARDRAIFAAAGVLGDRLSLVINLVMGGDDGRRLQTAVKLSRRTGVALLATNQVHYHDPSRRPLQDVLTCVRHGCVIHDAGHRLFANAERYLKSPEQMHALLADYPQAIARGLEIVRRCTFDLGELKYEYPVEAVPAGASPTQHLRTLTYDGAAHRYPDAIPGKVRDLLEKELKFISGSKYESYFLTVHDLVRYARSRGILCQGRGSAANSAVCYCLGVTSVDPDKFQLVFERFASEARNEPPDIDIDFEHERREEVIQYVYEKYGRNRAAMTASLTTYRGRSAVRDVGKVLGLGGDLLDHLADKLDWWHTGTVEPSQLIEAGVNPDDPTIRMLLGLTGELLGFPRHLSQHVGGMVICRGPLDEVVPIENAAMTDRTVIQWDKDDLDTIGLFKIDLLALGMLTAISKSLVLIGSYGPKLELHTIPSEDPATYDMACDADTVGVFQIESRAQMSMLPRLQPRRFYDLVIEVAIVRPGPIQGGMVHPYLQRRELRRRIPGYEPEYEKPELREVLKETLGVPLFQEQAMRMSIVAAGFTGAQADQLRRAMAAWKRGGGLEPLRDKFITGMLKNGYSADFTERCFKQISGFGQYGFPESHAASFAKLVYASCWIKRHHPAAFLAALMNSQPMGFYAPAQLVRDAREHGVDVRPADINSSDWDCTLEPPADLQAAKPAGKQGWGISGPAVRLGFRQIKGFRQTDADRIVAARRMGGSFESVDQLRRRAGLEAAAVRRLAGADAMVSLELGRRRGLWEALGLTDVPAPLMDAMLPFTPPATVSLPPLPESTDVRFDYQTTGLSLKKHPVSFARETLTKLKVLRAADLQDPARCREGAYVRVAGLVLVRQRPGTAAGVVFITLEDETGIANLILWSAVYEKNRRHARHAVLLQADGILQRQGIVVHVVARRLHDRTELIPDVEQRSRDFR